MNVSQYNALVEHARSLGLLRYRPIKRFRPAESGPAKLAQIEQDIRAAQPSEVTERETVIAAAVEEALGQEEDTTMAKAAKKTKAPKAAKPKKAAKTSTGKRGRPPTNGETIAAKTAAYNELVPTAKKKGVAWAKNHTSFFGSHTAADAQLKRIQDAIKAA